MGRDAHKFAIGSLVTLAPSRGVPRNVDAVYKVVAQLPSDGAHLQYRIRNGAEAFERVAAENELMSRARG